MRSIYTWFQPVFTSKMPLWLSRCQKIKNTVNGDLERIIYFITLYLLLLVLLVSARFNIYMNFNHIIRGCYYDHVMSSIVKFK